MSQLIFRFTSLITLLTLTVAAHADSPDSNEPVGELPVSELASAIDEVTVVEQKPVNQLRSELARVDARVFSLYNDLNTDDSLDMICKKETRIGSQIKYRVCKSAYHRQVEGEFASEFLEGDGASTSGRAPAGHYDEVRTNMSDLMKANPELRKAFYERAVLRKRIREQKEKD